MLQRGYIIMQLLHHIDKPGVTILVDIPLFYLHPPHHQVAHAEGMLTIEIGGHITVGWG